MKKLNVFSVVMALLLPTFALAGLFDTIDSVGVIQPSSEKESNRAPASLNNEDDAPAAIEETPTITTLDVPAESDKPNPSKVKTLKRGLSQQAEHQRAQIENQKKQNSNTPR